VIELVDNLLRQGLAEGASDIHVEPSPDGVLVRTRVDGFLARARQLPLGLHGPLVSRIKMWQTVPDQGGTPSWCRR
jgi:type II secretory ATPase GspE/PulE/Tfp pilus assembly ATPase PilB-like protein